MEADKQRRRTSVAINMISGAGSGALEVGSVYPMDSVRTRMQSLEPKKSKATMYSTIKHMVKTEGPVRPFRGMTVVLFGTMPACALYYGSYEIAKDSLSNISARQTLNYIAAGVVATVLHDVLFNPSEVIKQRIQMHDSPYKTIRSCARAIYYNEGPQAFYRSFTTQLTMNIPVQAIHLMTYEHVRIYMNNRVKKNYDTKGSIPEFLPIVHIVAGAAAGATTGICITPLDVVRTLLNTQEAQRPRGMIKAIRFVKKIAGFKGFTKGLTPRMIKTTLGGAIGWTSYEFFKATLIQLYLNPTM